MSNAEGSTCSTPQRSASGEDSDSDYENENVRPRGLTGLQNLGNTCYLNSALQSLSNCPPLTRYFLDCPQLILPDKTPMLSRSYLKLITELWHKKRPSYVVPSGVVTGIKAVHPMFRGYTQQDAQEFLRCLMDQLHEELKVPYSDDSESEDEDAGGGGRDDDGSNNATSAGSASNEQKVLSGEGINRRPSFDSISSQSELDYETCDSGLSSERSSNGGRDAGSSDENNSDTNDGSRPKKVERARKSSAATSQVQDGTDCVANTKEMKETANLLEKKSESDTHGRRHSRNRPVMEGGDSREQGSTSYLSVPVKDVESPTSPQPQQTQPLSSPSKPRKVKNTRFESIISQTFDGKILSSVRCLNCNTVSTTKETFQDLSLPIPSKDHLHMLHSGYPAGGVVPPKGGTCGEVHQGWLAWMYTWMKSWFIGPTITLQDCLLAFFSADELKGDNMYSCEKCKKLRNGLKYSKVLQLPEILSIHLKRFRHEFYSSKISTYISFPLEGLDMEPYLYRGNISESKFHKACKDEVTLYDLVAIICHHGTAGGGHYTAYCLNHLNEQWYEFDDQYVTEVDISQVQNCEAYVLFYRKSNKAIENVRQKVMDMEHNETSILRFYISKQWMSRFNTFAEPGPITNKDFLCKHGGVPPGKVSLIYDLTEEVPQSTWELLYNRFGGGPVCNHLYTCKICHSEQEKLRQRQKMEKETFIQLNEDFQEEHTDTVYAISMAWFKEWEAFVKEKTDLPPGPIENSRIIVFKNAQPTLRQTSDYGQLSKDMWLFLHRIYGGGPELIIRQSAGTSVKPTSSSPTPTTAVTQPVTSPPVLSSSPSGSALSQSPQSPAVTTSPATSFETTASQTASVSSVSTSTSTHPPSSSTSRSCDSGSPVSNEVRDSSSTTLESHVEPDTTTTALGESHAHTPLYKDLEPDSSSIPSAHRPAPNEDVEKALDPNDTAGAVSTSSAAKTHSTPSCTLQANKNEKKSPDKHETKPARDTSAQPKLSPPSQKNTNPRGHSKHPPKAEAESGEIVSSSICRSAECIRQSDSSTSLFKSKAASSDSLPDSGFGTDLSCNDLLSVVSETCKAGGREKVSAKESLSDVTNLDLPCNTSEESSLLPTSAGSEISQESKLCPPAEAASAKGAAPYVATFGKGKRRNKKGKHMDVTKI
ncbi:ubiquitin carboxyl-terminal hydrolase 20-like [Physella acuta]|uniref:ubiquitin carboxyl-terminal hydrolase 20-like n=1 Tax=Physella acuta TaxID=109671 RepID=UPI0027DCA84E|nr:ubiquitin carboxyl-terminal hydrolase 20-like [Physella acuta]XP_059175994.1 ubiquitin carboxyl-terminal hydrolase 20-like [Physella acuta]